MVSCDQPQGRAADEARRRIGVDPQQAARAGVKVCLGGCRRLGQRPGNGWLCPLLARPPVTADNLHVKAVKALDRRRMDRLIGGADSVFCGRQLRAKGAVLRAIRHNRNLLACRRHLRHHAGRGLPEPRLGRIVPKAAQRSPGAAVIRQTRCVRCRVGTDKGEGATGIRGRALPSRFPIRQQAGGIPDDDIRPRGSF